MPVTGESVLGDISAGEPSRKTSIQTFQSNLYYIFNPWILFSFHPLLDRVVGWGGGSLQNDQDQTTAEKRIYLIPYFDSFADHWSPHLHSCSQAEECLQYTEQNQ